MKAKNRVGIRMTQDIDGSFLCDGLNVPAHERYKGVLLYADLDGTLLDPDRTLSPDNLDAIGRFISLGGRFGVATGRMERSLQLNFPELKTNLPCVFYNGALVQWHPDGEILRKMTLKADPVPMLQAVLEHCPEIGIEVLSGGNAHILRWNAPLRAQLRREGLHAVSADWGDIPPDWYKVLLAGERPKLAEARALMEPWAEVRFDLLYSEETLLEVMQPAVSKGDAVLWVRNQYGAECRLTVAVGDNDNDADMIAVADIGIVMANGTGRAKESAAFVIPDNRQACIPLVLALLDRHLGFA